MYNRPNSIYTTPQLVSDQLQKALPDTPVASETAEYNDYYTLVQRYCRDYSKIIEEQVNATFVPYYESKTDYFGELLRDGRFQLSVYGFHILDLPDALLSLDSIVFNGTTLTSSQYRAVGLDNRSNTYPYYRILFDSTSLPSYDTDFDSGIVLTGEWGTHDNSSNAYSTVTTTAEALDASETGIDITDGDGALFDVYQYIRIDDELMLITAITTSGDPDVLTVEREVNGFTAATHDSGATITRWNVPRDVQELATRMVAYFFNKRDDSGERVQFINDSVLIAQFSKEIAAIARRRQRSLFGVA